MSDSFFYYQRGTASTAVYPGAGGGGYDALSYVTLGLAGEAGEIANKVKKVARDMGGVVNDSVRLAIRAELGDVLWYLSQLATELGYELDEVADANLKKLAARKAAGTIQGSGDNR